MVRIWNLRLNLDELNALVGSAFSDSDRAGILMGLALGLNGGESPEQCSNGVRRSFEVGSKWREEAEGYAKSQSIAGKASAESRKMKSGTAQPSKVVRTVFDETSNLTTIHNPQSKQTNKPAAKKKSNRTMPDELSSRLEALCTSWPGTFVKDGQTFRLPKLSNANDLWDRLIKFFPNDDPEEMIMAGEKHIQPKQNDDWSFNEAKKQGFTIAMTNFYGQQARWKEFR